MSAPAPEEGKLISEALNTVKIQVQQMKRHLVSDVLFKPSGLRSITDNIGVGSTHGRFEERKFDACRAAHVFIVAEAILRTLSVFFSVVHY
jgi:hypothetical protein